VTHD
jgi:sporulation protein YlmC with PRC-barrel domain